jgi:hypothetical protein
VLGGVAEDDTANTTEAVDANLDGSHFVCVESAGASTSVRELGELWAWHDAELSSHAIDDESVTALSS